MKSLPAFLPFLGKILSLDIWYRFYIYTHYHLKKALSLSIYFLKILFIYSWETHTERGRDTGRGRSRLHAGSTTWNSIPGLQDPGPKAVLNRWATWAAPVCQYFTKSWLAIDFIQLFFIIYWCGHMVFFFKKTIYLFMRDTERNRGTGKGRSRLPVGSPTQN